MTNTTERLRDALAARADLVTPESLRPAAPPAERPRRMPRWSTTMLSAAAGVSLVVGGLAYVATSQSGTTEPGPVSPPETVTGTSCPHEEQAVDRALRRDFLTADVDGDGAPDRVAGVFDEGARPGCRAFVAVRTANGSTYSAAVAASPGVVSGPPFGPDVIGLPRLGAGPAQWIVVDTHARADGAWARLYTLTSEGLVLVEVPGSPDGGFYVEGGGVTAPQGADCTASGGLVVSSAQARGTAFEVTRRVFPVGEDGTLGQPQTSRRQVVGSRLVARYPEFGSGHFSACGGAVPR